MTGFMEVVWVGFWALDADAFSHSRGLTVFVGLVLSLVFLVGRFLLDLIWGQSIGAPPLLDGISEALAGRGNP